MGRGRLKVNVALAVGGEKVLLRSLVLSGWGGKGSQNHVGEIMYAQRDEGTTCAAPIKPQAPVDFGEVFIRVSNTCARRRLRAFSNQGKPRKTGLSAVLNRVRAMFWGGAGLERRHGKNWPGKRREERLA